MRRFYAKGKERLPGLYRFAVPMGLSVVLWLISAVWWLEIPALEAYHTVLTSLMGAVGCTVIVTILAQVLRETRKAVTGTTWWLYGLAAVSMVVLYSIFTRVSMWDYRFLYSLGLAVAGAFLGFAVLARQYGRACWNYLCWAGLKCLALGMVVAISLGICGFAWDALLVQLPPN